VRHHRRYSLSVNPEIHAILWFGVILSSRPVSCGAADAAATDSDRDQTAGLETITVTARKVTENLQKTPAAVTALSGGLLVTVGAHDLRAVQNLMPSVRFQAENASTEVYIRGVGSTLDLPNIEPPTVVNFDGAYVPREATSVGLFDVARVELLPGPQGTLYGRAALGGTVNVEFNRPSQQLETSAVLELGNDALVHGMVAQNLPVNEKFALRGAFDYVDHDGYQRTGADSSHDYAARLSGRFQPNDDVDLYVWTHGARREGDSANLVRRGYNDGTFDGDPDAFDHDDPWDDRIDPDAPTASPNDYESLAMGAQLQWHLLGVNVTYIPSYVYLDWVGEYWLENIGANLSAHYNQFTHELRVANSEDDTRLRWIAGAYTYDVRNSGDFFTYTNTPQPFPLAQISDNQLTGYALFGEATYALTDSLRLVAGLRTSWDRREGRGHMIDGTPYDANQDYQHVDWKIGAEFDAAESVMLYATVQTGYQPGTYNMFPATAGQSNLVDEASMTAYTVGFKSRAFDERLQVNDELFFYDYTDLLVQSFNFNTFLLTTFNASRASIYGNQLDVLFEPVQHGLLNLTVGYLKAEYDEFVVPADINTGTTRRDFGGYRMQYAPEWTVSAGYQHDFPIGASHVRARLETRYEDSFWGTFAHNRGTQQQAYLKTDASLTYYGSDDRWSVGLWIRNIENEAVLAATTTGQLGPYGDAFIEPPRTFGLRVTFRL
jgi:iron complex outermembrane receptor protein